MTYYLLILLHLDRSLGNLIQQVGPWAYAVVTAIIFCETGLVVTPFLPGDSLLFAAGALAAQHAFHIGWLWFLLAAAAIVGDTVNYWIGHALTTRIFLRPTLFGFRLNPEHLTRTQAFYERYGAKAIVLGRFVPIVRTFVPFVAGVGRMHYGRFLAYNVLGGVAWISLFLFLGYFFGNIPTVKDHFGFVVIGIIALSIVPMALEFFRVKRSQTIG